jgi:hypothetical protein
MSSLDALSRRVAATVVAISVSAACSLCAACSLRRWPIARDERLDAGRDGGRADGGGGDAGIARDGSIVDGGAADAAADSGSDAGRDGGPTPLRRCDETYGGVASDYILCAETELDCEFYVLLSGASCATLCERAGGACITTYADQPGDPGCIRAEPEMPCDTVAGDQLCICSRIP